MMTGIQDGGVNEALGKEKLKKRQQKSKDRAGKQFMAILKELE
ncbi:MAG TPA: hypothetical protein VK469_15835 [Candidatus Kapabacteria bacterium]|nr:hypothetical protein [Candidatus Kapabacteria bacterium]